MDPKKRLQELIRQGFTSAQRLLAMNMDVSALRTATLRREEWQEYDGVIVRAAQDRLVGVADLISRGLTKPITNGLGRMVLVSERQSDVADAEMSMDGTRRGKNDRVEFDALYLPLPIIHKDFEINARQLMASRQIGDALDTTNAALAGTKVADKLETVYFNGSSSYKFGGGIIYGLTDFPYRNTGSLTVAWTGATGAQVVDDVRAMKQKSLDDKQYGPWILYVCPAYETVLDKDYDATRGNTIRQRILAIGGIADVKVADKLATGQVVLVQMKPETVRLVEGLPLTTVEWQSGDTMLFNFKVLTISVPEIRADQEGNCGVVHYSA